MGKRKEKGNGEGTLYKNQKTDLYIGQYVVNGKRHSIYQKKNEKIGDFKKRFNDILSSINTGTYVEKSTETLLQILEHHIEQKLEDGTTVETSYNRDLDTLEQLKKCCENFINKSIQKITVEDIEKSKSQMRDYSKSCIDKMWRLLTKAFKIAYSRRKTNYNIMEDETLIKPVSKKNKVPFCALSVEQEKKLKEILKSNRNQLYANIILLQLYTGARIGEILAFSKDCIDTKNNTITIYRTLTKDKEGNIILGKHTKTYDKKNGIDKGKRTFPMNPNVKKIIDGILKSKITNINNLLFWDYSKNTFIKPYEINAFLYRLNKANNICDFSLSSHKLRHTFITRCQEQNMPLVVLQALVGHVEGSSITNEIYTSVSVEFMEKELKKVMQ